jgi:hypothetical protein
MGNSNNFESLNDCNNACKSSTEKIEKLNGSFFSF